MAKSPSQPVSQVIPPPLPGNVPPTTDPTPPPAAEIPTPAAAAEAPPAAAAPSTTPHLVIPMVAKKTIRGFIPGGFAVHFWGEEEKMVFAQMTQGLIAAGAVIDGKHGPRPVKSGNDVVRWIVRNYGQIPPRKKTHKANGLKKD